MRAQHLSAQNYYVLQLDRLIELSLEKTGKLAKAECGTGILFASKASPPQFYKKYISITA